MSRTIRRTTAKARYPRFVEQYARAQPDLWLGMTRNFRNQGAFPWLPLEEPAYTRVCRLFHSDKGLPEFGFEEAYERPLQPSEKRLRGKAKREIQKWLRDPEHEIAFSREPQFYDWP